MFNVKPHSQKGLYLNGFGIRLSNKFFLAHIEAMSAISRSLNETKQGRGFPGIFNFDAPLEFDKSEPNRGNPQYAPMHNKTVAHGIGIYWAAIREAYQVGRFEAAAEDAHKLYKLFEQPRLSSWRGANTSDLCELLVYSEFDNSKLRLVSIDVARKKCTDDVCQFDASPERDAKKGKVCGKYSDLGAPVICQETYRRHVRKKVRYIVTNAGQNPKECSYRFEALDIAPYANDIMDHVEKYDNS